MAVLLLIGCRSNTSPAAEKITSLPAVDSDISNSPEPAAQPAHWQLGFPLTHDPAKDSIDGRPVSFYLSNPVCLPLARAFYTGEKRPTDDDSTSQVLDAVCSGGDKLRPFYRWCLDKSVSIADGALAEAVGLPARKYAEKFPGEFISFIDADTSGRRRAAWTEAISYSGFYEFEDVDNAAEVRKNMLSAMNSSCPNCPDSIKEDIREFVNFCFR